MATGQQRTISYTFHTDVGDGVRGIGLAESAIKRAGDAADRGSAAFLKFGRQGQLSAQQMQALSYQTTDIVTQLAGGQNPLLILLQQGGQLRDQFGGIGPLFKAIGTAVASTGGAMTLLAAGMGGVVYTAYKASQELSEFEKGLALSGNRAGLLKSDLADLSREVQALSGNTLGSAREAVAALGTSGAFTSESLGSVAAAAALAERVTGEKLDSIVKRYVEAAKAPTQFAIAQAQQYGHLTAAQIEQIRILEAQGKRQAALKIEAEAFAAVVREKVLPAMSEWDKYLQTQANAWSQDWQRFKGLFESNPAEQLAKAEARYQQAQTAIARGLAPQGSDAAARAAVEGLRRQIGAEKEAAAEQAATREKNNEDILKGTRARVDSELAIERAGAERRLGATQAALDIAGQLFEDAYRRLELGPAGFAESFANVQRAKLEAELKFVQDQIGIEWRRKVESPEQTNQRLAAIIQLQARMDGVAAKRAKLEADLAQGRVGPNYERGAEEETPNQAFRKFEQGQSAAIESAQAAARQAAQGRAHELIETNRQLGIELIRDDQVRGKAQLAEEERQLRERLNLAALNAEERQAVEERLAEWRAKREELLTEQLKPEWQRRLDLYADSTRHMRLSFDQAMDASLQASEDMWVDLVTKGEFSAKRLVGVINEQLARIGWQKYLAKPAASAFEQLFGAILGGGGGAAGGTTDYPSYTGGSVYHAGGVAGRGGGTPASLPMAAFARAPRYHGGGIAGEVYAKLKVGEEVLTERDPRHRDNGGLRSSGPLIQQTNIYQVPAGMSPAAYAAALQQHQRQAEARTVADAMRPGTPLNLAIRGAR